MEKQNMPLRILMADDDADDRELFQDALLQLHKPVFFTAFENGEILLEHLIY